MTYANQASLYFLGYHLAFHGSHLKSDVIVVGFNAIHHSGVLSSHHGLWDRFFIKHAAALLKRVISTLKLT